MPRDSLAPHERIAWAVEHSQRTLVSLAEEIGCSHAALSQWATGRTRLENVKVGLISAFAAATGVRLEWLLSGEEPAILTYGRREHPLVEAARLIASESPAKAEVAERLLRALDR